MCDHHLRAFRDGGIGKYAGFRGRESLLMNEGSCEAKGATLDRVPASQPSGIDNRMLGFRFCDCNMKMGPNFFSLLSALRLWLDTSLCTSPVLVNFAGGFENGPDREDSP